jgi:hypothetical protein
VSYSVVTALTQVYNKEFEMFIAEIETRVAGIPAIIGVTDYTEASYNSRCDSDVDFYGSSQWIICDRRSRYAKWLERKLTKADRERIESEIAEYFN